MKSNHEKLLLNSARALKRMMSLCERVARSGKEVRRVEAYRQAESARNELLRSVIAAKKVAKIARDGNAVRKSHQIAEPIPVLVIIHRCHCQK